MAEARLVIGEFAQLGPVEIAEIGGTAMDACCAKLATRPPFRPDDEKKELSAQDEDEAYDLAVRVSGISALLPEIREADPDIHTVIISTSGGLVVRSEAGSVEHEVLEPLLEYVGPRPVAIVEL